MAGSQSRRSSKRKAEIDTEGETIAKRRPDMDDIHFQTLLKELQSTKQALQAGQSELNLKVEAVKDQVRAEMSAVTGRITNVETKVSDLSERVSKIESMPNGGVVHSKSAAFWAARRSFVCGPASEGDTDVRRQFRMIMVEKLKMREWEAEALDVEDLCWL